MQRIISPTVGRKVWYTPDPAQDVRTDKRQPYDATICYVWSDRMVNLSVSDHNGRLVPGTTSVQLMQPGDETPNGAYCEWMPYQVGQAERAQAAENRLAAQAQGGRPTP